jgi:hypothetical protein
MSGSLLRMRSLLAPGVIPALGLLLGTEPPRAAAQAAPSPAPQASAAPTRARKSVYGKLQSVEKRLSALVMTTDDGQRMVWRFDKALIAEAERFKPGDPMIVIYRQLGPSDKRVTAVAFPGTAAVPTYVNLTTDRVTVRSAPFVDGACPLINDGPLQEITIPRGGVVEVADACWCCTTAGDACVPANKTGVGRALLANCFE